MLQVQAPDTLRAAGALGTITKLATPPLGDASSDARKRRYTLQDVARRLVPEGHRTAWCLSRKREPGALRSVEYSPKHKSAHYGNVLVCGNVWTCPVCSSKVTEKRRAELAQAVAAHPELTAILVTLTLSHHRGDNLTDSLDALNDAWRRMQAGAPWQRVKRDYAIVASVAALEVTVSPVNGWHPHKHVLFFSERPRREIDAAALRTRLSERWLAMLSREGATGTDERAVDVTIGGDAAALYLAKYGHIPTRPVWDVADELTKSGHKRARLGGHYTPFQLLELVDAPQNAITERLRTWAAARFTEYTLAMVGKSQLRYGTGSRARLGLVAPEATDEELADEVTEEAMVMTYLTDGQFSTVVARRARGDVLEVARQGSAARLWMYLEDVLGLVPTEAQLVHTLDFERNMEQLRIHEGTN